MTLTLCHGQSLAAQYLRLLLDEGYEPVLSTPPFLDSGPQGMYDADTEEEKEEEAMRKRRVSTSCAPLGHCARARFEAMLRALTPRRERIARAMQFAIEHAYAASQVCLVLSCSCLLAIWP